MLLAFLALVAALLTYAMFHTKESMLGFPCALFWALMGGQAFYLSTATWDIYYLMGFGSLLGMTSFTSLAAFALREKRDAEAEGSKEAKEDLGGEVQNAMEEPQFEGDSTKSSRRTRGVEERAKQRRERTEKRWGKKRDKKSKSGVFS